MAVSAPLSPHRVGGGREGGALGARMTGAGWGGCVVAVTRREDAAKVMDAVWSRYFQGQAQAVGEEARNQVLFATRPCAGAALLPLP